MSEQQGSTTPENGENHEPEAPEKTFTQADLDRIIASRVGPLQQKAAEYDRLLESQKTEAEKQADVLAKLKAENEELRSAQARRVAAEAAKLPIEAHDGDTGLKGPSVRRRPRGVE